MTFTILTFAGAYALLAALLAFILLSARLHPVIKLVAAAATAVLMTLTYIDIGELRGLPSDSPLPNAFKLHWARVVEPNQLHNEPGHVFLWVEALDQDNYPSGVPRAYQLPYDPELVKKVEVAMGKITAGESIAGKVDADVPQQDDTAEELALQVQAQSRPTQDQSTQAGERYLKFDPANLAFGEMPAPVTPDKPQ
ncbi:MAG: hypothetical protein KDJ19_10930 [Hyphomicrobiaceae bacterium]|nr:hypothetical protein [Hyphomicrobiaceae bacterium]MCC0025052.1 hypothetical protein [Hyphomicrobiaceae bacterium]